MRRANSIIALPIEDGAAAVGVPVYRTTPEPSTVGVTLVRLYRRVYGRIFREVVAATVFAGVADRLALFCHTEQARACDGLHCRPDAISWIYRLYPSGIEVWGAEPIEGVDRHTARGRVDWDAIDYWTQFIDMERKAA